MGSEFHTSEKSIDRSRQDDGLSILGVFVFVVVVTVLCLVFGLPSSSRRPARYTPRPQAQYRPRTQAEIDARNAKYEAQHRKNVELNKLKQQWKQEYAERFEAAKLRLEYAKGYRNYVRERGYDLKD